MSDLETLDLSYEITNPSSVGEGGNSTNDPLFKQVKEVLESVRGYLQADGGDLNVLEVGPDYVEIEFLGACTACSMSDMTLKLGIEQAIFKSIPCIKEVRVRS